MRLVISRVSGKVEPEFTGLGKGSRRGCGVCLIVQTLFFGGPSCSQEPGARSSVAEEFGAIGLEEIQ